MRTRYSFRYGSVTAIRKIGNVNVLVYSKETAPLVQRLPIRNMNVSVEIPDTAKKTIGQMVVSKESTQEKDKPEDHVLVGQMLVEPDVTGADLERMFGSLIIVGQVLCPDSAMGVLKAKATQMVGQSMAYPSGARLIMSEAIMDEKYLIGLEDSTKLVVVGSLRVPKEIPAELFERKINLLKVIGNLRCPEENAGMIRSRLADGPGRIDIVPTGYVLVEKPLVLDETTLDILPGSKLYCLRGVKIESDVDAAQIDERIEKLISKQMVLCPSSLRGVLAGKCDLLETRVVFYEGILWMITGDEQLTVSRFEYLEEKATLVVKGDLVIDADVEPRMLAERLDKVYNFGDITCTKEQRGALESRLAQNEGDFIDSYQTDDETTIGNVNHLTL